jgi:solute carrier family 1 (neutral amino acid transporter) protein 5
LPFGITFLIAGTIIEISDVGGVALSLGWWLLCSIGALTLHFFITLPLLFAVFTHKNPYRFVYNQLAAYVNVLGHSSR